MSQYQLIAFDMDGTLLNSNKQISPETLNAIKRATDAGKTVILCTGRNLAELNAFTEIIPGLRYLDCVSGACVYDLKEKKTLYSQALDPGIVKKLMEFGMEEGAMIMYFQSVPLSRRISSPIWLIFIWAFTRPCLIRSLTNWKIFTILSVKSHFLC